VVYPASQVDVHVCQRMMLGLSVGLRMGSLEEDDEDSTTNSLHDTSTARSRKGETFPLRGV